MNNIIKDTFTYKIFVALAREAIDWLETLGEIGTNLFLSIKQILTGNISIKHTLDQSARFGFDSLPITLSMVGISGMIIALQVAYEMVRQGAGNYVGSLVAASIIREIGPIMGSFAVISMVGSSMAAEIATMKVTEQIDAIKVSGVDPVRYLIVPRILAGFLVMPFVITLANLVGIVGGMFTSTMGSDLNMLNYIDSVKNGMAVKDVFISLLKACIFGGIIAITSSSIGYKTKGGAIDVGNATTKAVVWSFVLVVVTDFLISLMFYD